MESLGRRGAMVVFECEKCNESLKKPKVAAHLLHCRSSWVTCIDCCKKFAWNEFEAHTTCVSEAQKYQGNLFQAKESTNKGLKKQNDWIDNVKRKIEDPGCNIEPKVKKLMENLIGFDNIPRKQRPFANFVKNSLKLWDETLIGKLWDVINVANAPPPKDAVPAAAATAVPAAATSKATGAGGGDAASKSPAKGSREWAGWKRALDDELKSAGGEMPWKRLRDALVACRLECGGTNGDGKEALGNEALASIPDSYLSKRDELVRLPNGKA